ncbi:Calpain catalytic domain-containing protein [Fusarium keratoplasticum]|nr:Calpain catalytic domain-containing protein [Fusarium keratoplasticum]
MSEKTKGVESNDDAILEKVSGESGKVSLSTSEIPTPGFWPDDMFKDPVEDQAKSEVATGSEKETWENVEEKKEGESRRPSQDSNSPPMERSARNQSTESKLVSTPATEAHSEEANSSDSSDTESECESGSDDEDSEPGSNDSSVRKQRKKEPWNPVCVIGLRVYAQHAGISVRLAEQKADDAAELLPVKEDDSTKPAS